MASGYQHELIYFRCSKKYLILTAVTSFNENPNLNDFFKITRDIYSIENLTACGALLFHVLLYKISVNLVLSKSSSTITFWDLSVMYHQLEVTADSTDVYFLCRNDMLH